MGLNYGLLFRRLWTKVHQIMSADAGEIVVCNAVFDCQNLVPLGDIRDRSAKSSEIAPKSMIFGPKFFEGEDPQILDLVFKIAPISDHVAKFCGDRPRPGDLERAEEKERKKRQKETAAKHKGCVALSRNGRP